MKAPEPQFERAFDLVPGFARAGEAQFRRIVAGREGDLQSLHKELFEIKFKGGEDLPNPSRYRQVRRTIARIKTILRQRQLAEVTK